MYFIFTEFDWQVVLEFVIEFKLLDPRSRDFWLWTQKRVHVAGVRVGTAGGGSNGKERTVGTEWGVEEKGHGVGEGDMEVGLW